MKTKVKVALNMTKLSVPEKITRSRFVVDSITNNPILFPSPVPTMGAVTNAINALANAYDDAADGGKTKTAMMHEKEFDLMKVMTDVAHYVERIANDDSEIIIAAGLEVKKQGQINIPNFSVEHTEHSGEVMLRVKPRAKTVYRWDFTKDPLGDNPWTQGPITAVASTNIQDLEPAVKYWFRVAFLGVGGETFVYQPIYIIVC